MLQCAATFRFLCYASCSKLDHNWLLARTRYCAAPRCCCQPATPPSFAHTLTPRHTHTPIKLNLQVGQLPYHHALNAGEDPEVLDLLVEVGQHTHTHMQCGCDFQPRLAAVLRGQVYPDAVEVENPNDGFGGALDIHAAVPNRRTWSTYDSSVYQGGTPRSNAKSCCCTIQ